MQPTNQDSGFSRRRFVETLAQGSLLAGAAAWVSRPVSGAEANPFAYDVSRFSRTDPALLRWEEVSRQICPGKGHRRLAFGPGGVQLQEVDLVAVAVLRLNLLVGQQGVWLLFRAHFPQRTGSWWRYGVLARIEFDYLIHMTCFIIDN